MNRITTLATLFAIALAACSDTDTKSSSDAGNNGMDASNNGSADVGADADNATDFGHDSDLAEGVRAWVDGQELMADDRRVSICAEDLPDSIELTIRSHDPACPEQTTLGGAGGEISLGFICDTLYVRAHTFVFGVEKPVQGTTDAVISYDRHVDPVVSVSSGTQGPDAGNPAGALTIHALEDAGNENYRVVLEGELASDPPVRFEINELIRTEYCLLP